MTKADVVRSRAPSLFFSIGVVVGICAAVFLPKAPSLLCSQQVVTSLENPKHNLKSDIVVVNCGATSDFITQVRVRDEGSGLLARVFGKAEVVFVADTNHGAARVNSVGLLEPFSEAWKSDYGLEISYPEKARVFRKVAVLNGEPIDFAIVSGR